MSENMQRIALIGIGSNSVRLLVSERTGEQTRVVERGEVVTRLAGYRITPDGRMMLAQDAIDATLEAAGAFATRSRELGADLAGLLATEAMRASSNGAELMSALERALGTEVRVLMGEEEARLGWIAAASVLDQGAEGEARVPVGVIDIGGGSTDLSTGYAGDTKPESVLSLDTGGRKVMSRFGLQRPVERTTLMGTMSALNIELARRASALRPRPEKAVVIGGTASVLANLLRNAPDETGNSSNLLLNITWMDAQLKSLSLFDLAGRTGAGVPPDRADIVVAGVAILLTILQAWGLPECYSSDRNILDGYLATLTTDNPVKST